jgi:predicted nucleic acid-binding protein
MPRVFADTNVLFPFSLMDLLLALAEDYVHDLVLTDRLLDEWQRVIVREQHRSESSAARIAAHIRAGFADAFVAEAEYKHLLAVLDGPDPDDLHHAAAAVVGRADTLITWNLADFPADALAAHGIAVTKPDPYLTHQIASPYDSCVCCEGLDPDPSSRRRRGPELWRPS